LLFWFPSQPNLRENEIAFHAHMTAKPRIALLLTSAWLIAAAALGTRVAFVLDQQRKIPHQILATIPFEQETGNIAFALSQGKGFSNLFRQDTGPTAWLAPVYPFVLSLIFRIFGALTVPSFFAAVLLNALFSAAATFPLYYLARQVAGRAVAVVTAWLWVFLPAGIVMPFEWIWDTSLSIFLATTLLWMAIRISSSANSKRWLVYSLLWAVALLTNPSLGIALPFFLIWAAMRASNLVQLPWRIPAIAVVLILLCCLPWTIRNYSAFHRFIPIRSSLPFELWIGNNDIFDPHAINGIQRITRFEETRHYAQLGENTYLDEKWSHATFFIRQKPALFFHLTGRKIIATWIGTEQPFNDFLHANSLLIRIVILCNAILTVGTALGALLLARSKNPFAFPLVIFPALFPLIYYVTHPSLRYRHPIDPILIFLTVFAVAASCSKKYRSALPISHAS
jgi:4-amino-4-deoxy-L-arabinose transferase-like glycosyltransferase